MNVEKLMQRNEPTAADYRTAEEIRATADRLNELVREAGQARLRVNFEIMEMQKIGEPVVPQIVLSVSKEL